MYSGALADLNLSTSPWNNNRYAFTSGNPTTVVELDGHVPLGPTNGTDDFFADHYEATRWLDVTTGDATEPRPEPPVYEPPFRFEPCPPSQAGTIVGCGSTWFLLDPEIPEDRLLLDAENERRRAQARLDQALASEDCDQACLNKLLRDVNRAAGRAFALAEYSADPDTKLAGKIAGRSNAAAGAVVTYMKLTDDGYGTASAATRTGFNVAGAVTGAWAVGELGAAAGGLCLAGAFICSPVFAAVGAVGGGIVGGITGDLTADFVLPEGW